MPTATGAPDLQTIVYAIGRGEYDEGLYHLDKAIHQRRDTFDRVGMIKPSVGDWVEIWDESVPAEGVKVPAAILGKIFRVVGFTQDKQLRCRVEAPFTTRKRAYARGDIVRVDRDWVYRVQYSP